MKRLTLWLVLALILAILLIFLLRKPPDSVSVVPPDLISSLPPDAHWVLYADCANLRSSTFFQQMLTRLPSAKEDKEYAEFVQSTGFDYARDLDRLAIAVRKTPEGEDILAVADGRFDRAKITAYALRTGRASQAKETETLIIPSGDAGKTIALAFLSDKRIAIADGTSLKVAPAGKAPAADSAMQVRIGRVAGSAIFAVGRMDAIPLDFQPGGWVSDQLLSSLRSIRWIGFAAVPQGDQMHVALEAECDTPGNARQLAWTLDGLRILGRAALFDPKARQNMDPALSALLDTVLREGQVTRSEQVVRLTFQLRPEILDLVGKPAASRRPATK